MKSMISRLLTRIFRKNGSGGGPQTRFHDNLTKADLVRFIRGQDDFRKLDILLHGPLFHNSPVYKQAGQRAYLDSAAAVDSLTGAAAENAGYTLDLAAGNAYLIIRQEMEETNNGSGNVSGDLEYQVNGGGYVALTAITTDVQINTGHACTSTDGDAAGNVLTTSAATHGAVGVFDNSAATGNVSFAGLDHNEFAQAVLFVAANLANNDTVNIRLVNATTWDNVITITISKAVTHTATAAQTVPTPSQSATGGHESQGTAAQTIPTPSQSATGIEKFVATAAQTVPTPSQSATGTHGQEHSATVGQTAPTPSQSATGAETFSAAAAQTVPTPTQQGTAEHPFIAASAQTIPTPSQSATGTHTGLGMTGAVAQTVPTPSQAATGSEVLSAAAAQTMPTPLQAATASEIFVGSVAQTAPTPTQNATGGHESQATAAQTVPTPTQSATGTGGVAAAASAARNNPMTVTLGRMMNR